MTIIVTGGAGFIGSNFIFHMLNKYPDYRIVCLDCLTYAGNLSTLEPVMDNPNFRFVKESITDREAVYRLFEEEKPDIVVNFAAESHVDRSIENPEIFLDTNIKGTAVLMDACRKYGIAPALHHPHSLDDMDALADAAPPALICDAPYCLKHFCSAIRGRQGYHPHIIGIYDEWNWLERPDSLCGAILLQSEKQIRLAVHELIGQIEHHTEPDTLSIQSRFYCRENFNDIPAKDLASRHLFPF